MTRTRTACIVLDEAVSHSMALAVVKFGYTPLCGLHLLLARHNGSTRGVLFLPHCSAGPETGMGSDASASVK